VFYVGYKIRKHNISAQLKKHTATIQVISLWKWTCCVCLWIVKKVRRLVLKLSIQNAL